MAQEHGKTVKNTFAPNVTNESFNAAELFCLIRHGFDMKRMSPEAQDLVLPKLRAFEAQFANRDPARRKLAWGKPLPTLEEAERRIKERGIKIIY